MGKSKLKRAFSGVTYCTQEQLISVFEEKIKKGVLRSYAIAYHDKDSYVSTDKSVIDGKFKVGDPKKPHLHFVIRLYNGSTIQTIKGWLAWLCNEYGEVQNSLVEACLDYKAMFRYLTHEDQPEKYHYNYSIIKSNDPDDFISNEEVDNSFLALEYMLRGYSLYQICSIFGRDFIMHYQSYKKLYNDIVTQEEKKEFIKKYSKF